VTTDGKHQAAENRQQTEDNLRAGAIGVMGEPDLSMVTESAGRRRETGSGVSAAASASVASFM
jgi:hypothetical protein